MKDEIKEIITEMQLRNGRYIICKNEDISFSDEDYKAHLLLDYITNLQEENEYSNYCEKKLREKITNLEYKITTLEDYKIRNEKAIEYIKKGNKHFKENYNEPYEYAFMVNADEIMKILKGKSDE